MRVRFTVAAAAAMAMFAASTSFAITSDHLQCFKIKDDVAKAAYVATLTPTDPNFTAAPGCTIKLPAKLLCVDTVKSAVVPAPPGAPDGDPAQSYLCYKTKCPVSATTWTADDQFGTHNLRVLKTGLLCAPVNTMATTTTLPTGCAVPGDCPGVDTECQSRTCSAGACGFSYAPNGTTLTSQTSGDCQTSVCDGAGGITQSSNPMDPPADDGNQCTDDTCVMGAPAHPGKPINTACAQGGGAVCDGALTCVACNSSAQCPGIDTECQSRTCMLNTCGFSYTSSGTPIVSQTAGDCQRNECNGAGGIVSNDDNTDVPDDGNQCTFNQCAAGVPSNPVVPNNTGCNQGGGAVCISGSCVPLCGDAVIGAGEGCDQGNLVSGDGCSSSCQVEFGYQCVGAPSVCNTVCGDGIVMPSEGCDDHNNVSGDGCSFSCTVEAGFQCSGSPSVCAPL